MSNSESHYSIQYDFEVKFSLQKPFPETKILCITLLGSFRQEHEAEHNVQMQNNTEKLYYLATEVVNIWEV